MHKKMEKIFSFFVRGCAFFSVSLLAFILFFIIKESIPIFKKVSIFQYLFGTGWRPLSNPPSFSIFPMILSTLYVSIVAIIIALPIGVGCALFLANFIKEEIKEIIKTLIHILAAIPSVIYGFIGLLVLVKFFENYFSLSSGESILCGGILLSIMILPYIISTCEESMTKIHKKYKISSCALGVSKWHMVYHLILPASRKSILAGTILALGRAMGETMAVMMVIGNAPIFPKLLGKGQTIPSLIALEMGSAQVESLHYHAIFASGLVLMVLLFIINIIFYYMKKNISY